LQNFTNEKTKMTAKEYRLTKGIPLARFEKGDDFLCIYLTPVSKPRMTQRDKWDKRPCVVRYRDYCDRLRATCRVAGYELEDVLFVSFSLPIPKSWGKKKAAEFEGKPHQQKPDVDNLVKAVMDALAADDKHVHIVHARKYWGPQGKPGQVCFYFDSNKM
jgi:Holliday junction resolvase RusA-like endonuclease